MLDLLFPKLHKEGYRYLAIAGIVTFIFLLLSKTLGLISIIITVWVYYFFIVPERFSINNNDFLISPADGVISQITETYGPKELGLNEKKFTRVSIFMNVFNCHVNRVPFSGTVTEIFYKPGKFINASFDKASEENERNYIKIKNSEGNEIVLVQIAGLIARRIVCEVLKDQKLKQGNRIGIIRFGSRADIYFENYKPLGKVNQKTIAGETLLAKK